jgi:hypothetical protein
MRETPSEDPGAPQRQEPELDRSRPTEDSEDLAEAAHDEEFQTEILDREGSS